ncbi:MAG: hypothetical protein NWE92_04100 [Candidatus Bathyarchaeota archaeon]|nr:hypothetical protein [Candidatus Bathyarchaeota archaeon]
MTLLGFNFTQQQAISYIKFNWKPGKKELLYVSVFLAVLILAKLYNMAPLATTYNTLNPIATPDPLLSTLKDFAVDAITVFAAFMLTYLYFLNSDRNPNTALKWGVAYSVPVAITSFVFWMSSITSNVAQAVISDILYLPATFFWGLLLTGGFYLFLVYRPKLNFAILSYAILLACYIALSLAVYGLGYNLTWAITDSLIAISLAGLFFAIKNQIRFQFPTVLIYGGIGLGFMLIYWISDFPYLDFVPYYVEFLAFTITGLALYVIIKQNIMGSAYTLPPPPPPPPAPT